jgi:hypothetical protein
MSISEQEVKRTPGPWAYTDWCATGPTAAVDYAAIDAAENCAPKVFAQPVVQARGIGKAVICTAYGMTAEEAHGNACLLASAPELLVALIEARTSVQANRDALYGGHYLPHTGDVDAEGRIAVDSEDALLSRIDAAIAKATGSAA